MQGARGSIPLTSTNGVLATYLFYRRLQCDLAIAGLLRLHSAHRPTWAGRATFVAVLTCECPHNSTFPCRSSTSNAGTGDPRWPVS